MALFLLLAGLAGGGWSCGDGSGGGGSDAGADADTDADTDSGTGGAAAGPRIASWLAKKDELIESGLPFRYVMSAWFLPEEAAALEANNPEVELLAGLSVNWVWENAAWQQFATDVVSWYRGEETAIEESWYLENADGERCAFGWAQSTGQEEIWAMDPRSEGWVAFITDFYKAAIEQPQHDGVIVDMVLEVSYCGGEGIADPDANGDGYIGDAELVAASSAIMHAIADYAGGHGKTVLFNAGGTYADIDAYCDWFDAFLMEAFLGSFPGSGSYQDGLDAILTGKTVVYAVDTDDTGQVDGKRMRLGLTVSLFNDDSFYAYDLGPADHGQAWWFDEYDAELGAAAGGCYPAGGGYRRDFERGTVVAAPEGAVEVAFSEDHLDATTGEIGTGFTVEEGDGRIFLKQ